MNAMSPWEAPASTKPTATNSFESEYLFLGTAIYSGVMPGGLDDLLNAVPDLKPEHFSEPVLGRIFQTILDLKKAGQQPEATVLAAKFSTDPAFTDAGFGDPYYFIGDMMDKAPALAGAISCGVEILEASQRRDMIYLAGRLREDALNPTIPAFETLTQASTSFGIMVQSSAPPSLNLIGARDAAFGTVMRLREEKTLGRRRGAMTGLRCFDQRLHGIQPGHLIIIGGRPSMGKTSLGRAAALGCARMNPSKRVLYFCLEMDRDEMSLRTLAQLTREEGKGIPYFDMQGPDLSFNQIEWMDELAGLVPENFILDDSASLSIEHVERRTHAERRKGELAAVFIDYLQIMQMPRGFNNSRNEAVGEITGRSKQLAKTVGCGVVALSQLSRGVESREDKRPMLSDLRDSGSVEQDANVVMFPYRESYYLERQNCPKDMDPLLYECRIEKMKGKMEVITAKFRGGAIGSDMQRYMPAFDIVANEDIEIGPWAMPIEAFA